MGHQPDYSCSICKKQKPRGELLAKKVSFITLGANGKTIKSRTPAWCCFDCLASGMDPDWEREGYDSPGLQVGEDMAAEAARRADSKLTD